MKQVFLLTIAFIVTILLGSFLTERVKLSVAQHLNYEGEYHPGWGQLFFVNKKMQNEFGLIIDQFDKDPEKYRASAAWKELVSEDERDHAVIGLSGKIFTLIMSALGLTIFFFRRSKKLKITWKDWVAVLLGLFFMRDVLVDSPLILTGGILCDHAKLWRFLGLPVFRSAIIFIITGLFLFLYILYKIPKNLRKPFIISGFLGSIIGSFLWVFYFGNLLL